MQNRHVMETPFGWLGLAWSSAGIRRLCLPETSRADVERRLEREPPSQAAGFDPSEAIERVARYFAGEAVAFDSVAVDLAGVDPFRSAIYTAARRLAHGETTTYGALAERAGHKGLTRETGQALGRNPVPLIVPCHRIVAAKGGVGGFSAPGGGAAKARMLALEGAAIVRPAAQATFAF